MTVPPPSLMTRWSLTAPVHAAETGIADIWQVAREDTSLAALKVYKNGNMQDEASGFDLLTAQDGLGAARIYRREGSAILMEWLDGPTLGDLVRAGDDEMASHALVDTALRLHQMPADKITTLEPLTARFQALFASKITPDCPAHVRDALKRATSLAHQCLDTQQTVRPLHGDLHHDNIKASPRGYLAFDAKGVCGDRHFELGNAFWNPRENADRVCTSEAILQRAAIWATGFNTTEKTLLEWAAAYTALSLSWTCKGRFGDETAPDIPYLDRLLTLIDRP